MAEAARDPIVGRQIGRRLARFEDRPLLRGEGRFLDDLDPPGTVHVAFARSVHAHAEIRDIDLGAVRRRGDVEAAFGPDDLGELGLVPDLDRPGTARIARPVLAGHRARFVGEAIAAVVAADRYRAEDALEDVAISYEPLPAVASIEAAVAPEAPQLHPGHPNVIFSEQRAIGECEAAFESAAAVVERTFRTPRYNATPIEGRGVLAVPGDEGIVLYSSTQIPHIVAETVAGLLGEDPARVVVRCPDIGGGFGQKAHVFPEEVVVAWIARRLGRPVKWVEDRAENMLSAAHAREQRVRVRAAADGDGRLVALEADVACDVGAYGIFPWGQLLEALGTPAMIPGPYRVRNYRYATRAVATNKAPQGAYRGVGLPVASFVHDRVLDILAAEVGIDRAEIRRRNFIPAAELPYETATGLRYDSGDYSAAFDAALAAIGYDDFEAERRRAGRGRRLGIGFGSYVEWTGTNSNTYRGRGMTNVRGYDAGRVAAEPDGTFAVWTSCPAIGQGVNTTFSQVVADRLGVPVESVVTRNADTGRSPPGSGSFASRSAISAGGALSVAATKVRERLIAAGAELLEANPADLVLEAGRVAVRGSPAAGVSFADLIASKEPGWFDVAEEYDPPYTAYPYATHACIVAVDAETGAVEILRYAVAEDCGPEINPMIVEGQVKGATAQGIGSALYEAMRFAGDGQSGTASLMDYLVPTAGEVPEMEVHHLETPAPDIRGGVKGVGEGGILAPPAALANAISDAVGAEINELPVTPAAIRAVLARARAAVPGPA